MIRLLKKRSNFDEEGQLLSKEELSKQQMREVSFATLQCLPRVNNCLFWGEKQP